MADGSRSLGIQVVTRNNTSIGLNWTAVANVSHYSVSWWADGGRNGSGNVTHPSIVVVGLDAGTWYHFGVIPTGDNSSDNIGAATAPNSVRDLRLDTRTNNSISLNWTSPEYTQGMNYSYSVSWTPGSNSSGGINTSLTLITVVDLDPGTLYRFTVVARKYDIASVAETLQVATVPNEVTELKAVGQGNDSITLNWTRPSGKPDPAYSYRVRWTLSGAAGGTCVTDNTSVRVEQLQPATLCNFSVEAGRHQVYSRATELSDATAPNQVTDLRVEAHNSSFIMLNWTAPQGPPDPAYAYRVNWTAGELANGTVISNGSSLSNGTCDTEDPWVAVGNLTPGIPYLFSVQAERYGVSGSPQSISESTAPSSTSVSCHGVSGGYSVSFRWSCPQGAHQAFLYQVGAGQRLTTLACEQLVVVGGLQPARSYPVRVWTVSNEKEASSSPEICSTDDAGVIAGSIIGVLLFVLLAGLLVFFLRRHGGAQGVGLMPTHPPPPPCLQRPPPQELASEGQGQSQMVAKQPENKEKNRYSNVLPYDSYRVPLQLIPGEPGSDYINASFIPGYESPREFVATQGPLILTVGDFWRLVWEQESDTVVMLTNCLESRRVKCEPYWPLDSKPCTLGPLRVTLLSETAAPHWTLRELQLQHVRVALSRTVCQFHYTSWPDHGTPTSPDPLLAFWHLLRSSRLDVNKSAGPAIVHCSAGVGRTGTLLALDYLLRQLDREGRVGVFNFVQRMRWCRPLMVQTEEQYVFLHQCILRYLQRPPGKGEEAEKGKGEGEGAGQADLLYENVATIQDYWRETGHL
uniref:protein-tyrosine-phosphatase n=1 Tax=Ornithorhynchus anatinus TaxID=9258 RepID=A0A6I8NBM6_ORNAN